MTSHFKQLIKYCNLNAIALTEQQTLILKIVCEYNQPINAQTILQALQKKNPTANRMTIHRTLDYLNKSGIIHKISFNNTYVSCEHVTQHNCQLLVCEKCGKKIEIHAKQIVSAILESSNEHDFSITNPIEIMGFCKNCTQKANS